MAAHCSLDIAPVPESVSRSMSTSSAWSANRLYPASVSRCSRSARVSMRIGSTAWIRKGSMMVRKVMVSARFMVSALERCEAGVEEAQGRWFVDHAKAAYLLPMLVQRDDGGGHDVHLPVGVDPPRDGQPHQFQLRDMVATGLRVPASRDDPALHRAHSTV